MLVNDGGRGQGVGWIGIPGPEAPDKDQRGNWKSGWSRELAVEGGVGNIAAEQGWYNIDPTRHRYDETAEAMLSICA